MALQLIDNHRLSRQTFLVLVHIQGMTSEVAATLDARHGWWWVKEKPPMVLDMDAVTYRLINQKDRLVSVEMLKPTGRRQIIPDFRDEAEANAWIIQTRRLMQAVHPHLPGQKSKFGPRNVWRDRR
jgi:hypothetical protein